MSRRNELPSWKGFLDRVEAFEQTLAATFPDLDKYKRLLGKRLSILKGPTEDNKATIARAAQSDLHAAAAKRTPENCSLRLRGAETPRARRSRALGMFRRRNRLRKLGSRRGRRAPASAEFRRAGGGGFVDVRNLPQAARRFPQRVGATAEAHARSGQRRRPNRHPQIADRSERYAGLDAVAPRAAPRRAGNPVPVL